MKDLLILTAVIVSILDAALYWRTDADVRHRFWWYVLPGSGFYLLLSSRWPFPAPNGWLGITHTRGLYTEFYVLPSLLVTVSNRNRSLHFELSWLVFTAEVNTFWKRYAPPAFYAEEGSE